MNELRIYLSDSTLTPLRLRVRAELTLDLELGMARSQNLEDSPAWTLPRPDRELSVPYNEQHRLSLEVLVSGGVESFLSFLRKERIPCFLSAAELRGILRSAAPPACAAPFEDSGWEQSAAVDGSSLTYFPETSDLEPPVLELGWPAFTAGSFRGVTRAVAHFQPAYGESIYCCKEAVRRMIRSAKEVIAIVTDSLTDLDIFRDLEEASSRRVPVYIVLDQSSISEFLEMCRTLHVCLDQIQNMRVRTITGSIYYLRSGARITGKVHERFMLIDGNRVATGSYRFNWTDGKLNSSNLIELSGQITESFDEEFRILYAQSFPVNNSVPSGVKNSGIHDCLLLKTPTRGSAASSEPMCLSSTPNLAYRQKQNLCIEQEDMERKSLSDCSTVGENWMVEELQEEIIAEKPSCSSALKEENVQNPSCHSVEILSDAACQIRHISTQTSLTENSMVQTNIFHNPVQQSSSSSPSSSSLTGSSPSQDDPASQMAAFSMIPRSNLRECFCSIAKERQLHYSTIRSKLNHMMLLLTHRCEQADIALSVCSGVQRPHRDPIQAAKEALFMGTWSRAQGLQ